MQKSIHTLQTLDDKAKISHAFELGLFCKLSNRSRFNKKAPTKPIKANLEGLKRPYSLGMLFQQQNEATIVFSANF